MRRCRLDAAVQTNLYACEIWSLIRREEHTYVARVGELKVPRDNIWIEILDRDLRKWKYLEDLNIMRKVMLKWILELQRYEYHGWINVA
jgi:hypothetical protein